MLQTLVKNADAIGKNTEDIAKNVTNIGKMQMLSQLKKKEQKVEAGHKNQIS